MEIFSIVCFVFLILIGIIVSSGFIAARGEQRRQEKNSRPPTSETEISFIPGIALSVGLPGGRLSWTRG